MRRCVVLGLGLLLAGVGACAPPPAPGPGSRTVPHTGPTAGQPSVPSDKPAPSRSTGSKAATPTARGDASRIVEIGWAGDAVPASTAQGLPGDPAVLLGSVASELSRPDVMAVNLEGTLGRRGLSKCQRWHVRDCHAFQAPGSYAEDVFAAAGVDAVNTANNHSFDHGPEGQADTRAALDSAGIAATGGVGEVTVVESGGVRIALVGLAPYGWGADFRDPGTIPALMRRATASADIVVALLHAGAEGAGAGHTRDGVEWYLGENRGNSPALARQLIDAGADLVVGSGPHVVRGMEFYRGRLIAYSLGNLVGYGGAFQTAGDLSLSGILQVRLRGDGTFVDGRLVPLRIGSDGIPRPDRTGATIRRVQELSASDFGARAARVDRSGRISER